MGKSMVNKKKTYKFFFIFCALILTTLFANNVYSKETITWPYVCFKPVYICENNNLIGGSGFHVLNLLWQEIPEYEHTLVQMPVKRILESAKEGEHQLFYGMYKTPQRETFLQYSIPCRISTPTFMVVRKVDLQKFGNGSKVSLQNVLEDKKKTFLYLQSVSFGKGIDELIKKYKGGENILTFYDTTDMLGKSLKLLLSNRIDCMLSLDGTRYDAKKLGVADKIAYLSITEQNQYDVGYIIAPKNAWGNTIINQVNAILRKTIPTKTFFQYFIPLVDEAMIPKLRQKYNEKILSPSKEKPGKKL